MAYVRVQPGESSENLLKRFRKKVTQDKILSTVRRKRYFVSKGEQRRLEKQKALRRYRRRLRRQQRREQAY